MSSLGSAGDVQTVTYPKNVIISFSSIKYYVALNCVNLNFSFFNSYRPLSKTVRFNVLKVIPAGSSSAFGKKAFTGA